MSIENSKVYIYECIFENNKAIKNGGAIYFNGNRELLIEFS